jgi:hypothetical protein
MLISTSRVDSPQMIFFCQAGLYIIPFAAFIPIQIMPLLQSDISFSRIGKTPIRVGPLGFSTFGEGRPFRIVFGYSLVWIPYTVYVLVQFIRLKPE